VQVTSLASQAAAAETESVVVDEIPVPE
jgi:hypothetical protein